MGDTPNPAPTPAPRGLIIAAPRSGSGKTTVTLGIQRALSRRGLNVQPFKCGPDYIDPAFHSAAARRSSFNLDSWAFTRAQLAELLARGSDADIAIAEGSMGLFDGVAQSGASGDGSNADIAAVTGWPVILVIDASGQAQSAAAIALGCRVFRDDITLAGVILNRVASPRHDMLLRKGMEKAGIPVLGAMPKRADLVLPERHLGLVQAGDTADLAARLDALAAGGNEVAALDFEASYGRTSMEYYDGFVFGLYAEARPDLPPVASGGRYDALTAVLGQGRSIPAVGGVIRPELAVALKGGA